MTTERLAALLHDADSHMHPVLSGYAPEPCDYHRAMARALERQGVRVGDDAGGLRAALEHILREAEALHRASAPMSAPWVADTARAALAAQPAPFHSPGPNEGLDRERLARGRRARHPC